MAIYGFLSSRMDKISLFFRELNSRDIRAFIEILEHYHLNGISYRRGRISIKLLWIKFEKVGFGDREI